MHIGIALHTLTGFSCLDHETIYHFLGNKSEHSVLTFFSKGAEWRAHFMKLPRQQFETALTSNELTPLAIQPRLPPWLLQHEGMDLDGLDVGRASVKKSYREWAQSRYEKISALVEDPKVLLADDPGKYIASFAARSKQHPYRIQLWYCAYLCFGQDLMALAPTFSNSGNWCREEHHSSSKKKLGRPSASGSGKGHSAIPLIHMIESSYVKYAGIGKTMAKIHRQSLIHIFGCRTMTDSRGRERYYHPEDKAFPSYQQYRYHVAKMFGVPSIRRAKLGDEKYRNRVADCAGRYSESVANLYEKTESDCYQVKERPKNLLSDEAGPALIVAREVDVVSGAILGIGFSYGSENSEAYRAMKFCEAVPKSYFCSLFGIPITDDEWPCQGLPPASTTDRGPGASVAVFATSENTPSARDIAPSYSGQSKATVESSHPRETQTAGTPSFLVSPLNAFELARREIYRVLMDNHAKDATERMTPEMVSDGACPSSAGIFTFLNSRGRTSAIPMSLETAVREFLTPVTFRLNRRGLWLRSLRYTSQTIKDLGLLSLSGKHKTLDIPGFALSLAVRVAWIEIRGKIYEVEAILPIRDDESQLDMSLSDLSQLEDRMRVLRSDQSRHAAAMRGKYEIRYQDDTGHAWDEAKRKDGKPPSRKGSRDSIESVATPKPGKAA